MKSCDLTEHLGVVADVALSHHGSQIPIDGTTKDEHHFHHQLSTGQRSRDISTSRSLPNRLSGWMTDSIQNPMLGAGSQGRGGSQSEEGVGRTAGGGGGVTGLLYSEFQRDQEAVPLSHASIHATPEASGGLLDASKTEMSALIHSLNALTENLKHRGVDWSPLMWTSIACLCYTTGLLTGWLLRGRQ